MDIRNTLNKLATSQQNAEPTIPRERVKLSSLESLSLRANQLYQATVLEQVRSNQVRSSQAGSTQTEATPTRSAQAPSTQTALNKTGSNQAGSNQSVSDGGTAAKTDTPKTNTPQTNPVFKNERFKNETAKNEAAKSEPVATQPSNTSKTSDVLPKPSTNQWVIQIQGKNLLVESPIPLQVGQGLILELKTNGPQGQAVLDISPSSAGLSHSNAASNHGNLANAQLSSTLLKSLTRLIADQSPLDSGLNQLFAQSKLDGSTAPPTGNVNVGHSETKSSSLDQAVWQLLRPLLLQEKTLLKALQPEQLTQLSKLLSDPANAASSQSSTTSNALTSNLTTPNLAASNDSAIALLKQALAQSGLGFEANLLKGATQQAPSPQTHLTQNQATQNQATQSPATPNTAAQALQQGLGLTDKLLKASPDLSEKQLALIASTLVGKTTVQNQAINSAQGPNSTQANNSTTTPGTQANYSTASLKQPELTAFKAWLQQAQASNSNPASQAVSQANTAPQNPSIGSDLKSVLLALTASLKNDGNSGPSTAGRTDSAAHNGPQYGLHHDLKQALEFPRISALIAQVEGQMKASAMLADQELSTGQLLKLLASMLNRIQFNQLNSLYQSQTGGAEGQTTQSWMFELPMQHQNGHVSSIQLRIDQHQQEQDEERARKEENADKEIEWKLSLAFQLDELGPMHIQVALAPPRITPLVWCESPQTYALLRQEQGVLTQQLAALGLNVEDIHCHRGRPKPQHNPIERSLIDLKA